MSTDPARLAEELEQFGREKPLVAAGPWIHANRAAILAALRASIPVTETADKHVESVIAKHRERAARGLKKYGHTLERTDLAQLDWLRHAQEEAMDCAAYLEVLIARAAKPDPVAEAERAEVEAGRAFLKRLRECEDDPRYMAVWTHYAMHGGQYDGPKYSEARNCYTVAIARTDAARKEAGR